MIVGKTKACITQEFQIERGCGGNIWRESRHKWDKEYKDKIVVTTNYEILDEMEERWTT